MDILSGCMCIYAMVNGFADMLVCCLIAHIYIWSTHMNRSPYIYAIINQFHMHIQLQL
jgi:hypothetical protein